MHHGLNTYVDSHAHNRMQSRTPSKYNLRLLTLSNDSYKRKLYFGMDSAQAA